MLSENIKKYRKENKMSQDELADKLNVSRQSVSLWENGQTQPTIDNIIALANIFNVTANDLFGDDIKKTADLKTPETGEAITCNENSKNNKSLVIIAICCLVVLLLALAALLFLLNQNKGKKKSPAEITIAPSVTDIPTAVPTSVPTEKPTNAPTSAPTLVPTPTKAPTAKPTAAPTKAPTAKPTNTPTPKPTPKPTAAFDLFEYYKNLAIKMGRLNGDYTIYQVSSDKYGGRSSEYFSLSYWGDSDMVEFCLHCPLDDTFSINFYLRMRGGYNGKYEYSSSRYYRDDGTSKRSAYGTIDPAIFSDHYPLNCSEYYGPTDGQNEFMEESRVGICDLIDCIKKFTEVEKTERGFSAFGFKNF